MLQTLYMVQKMKDSNMQQWQQEANEIDNDIEYYKQELDYLKDKLNELKEKIESHGGIYERVD